MNQRPNQPGTYRYTPARLPGPCPDHTVCLILRCQHWLCDRTFHLPLNQPGQPRRFCSPRCRVAEHRRLHM
ncbi:MAG: hypothetical protein DLM61_25255 [Pseudonocardiales bacterium]|nr:MAG: hypothetical protein DLM61_25255 [Pseudonocardiales bacterium]